MQSISGKILTCVLSVLAVISGLTSYTSAQSAVAAGSADRELVTDSAGLLTQEQRNEISKIIDVHNKIGPGTIFVITIEELPPNTSIEKFAHSHAIERLSEPCEKNDHILFVVALKDRKLRIEASPDVACVIPDDFCQKVIDETVVPRFKEAKYYGGIRAGIMSLIDKLKQEDAHCGNAATLAMEGDKLSPEDAENLERKIEASPNDVSSRIRLLGYYFIRSYESNAAREMRSKHIIWIIQNRPDHEIAGLPFASLDPLLDKEAYPVAKREWLRQIEAHNQDVLVLGNAAKFFFLHDKELAENLLKRAQALEPNNPVWSDRLSHLYSLGLSAKTPEMKKETAAKALIEKEKALENTAESEKFYMLADLAKVALEADEIDKAKSYASELLSSANRYPNDWNYGNAIHHGNLILGRIALRLGDLTSAKKYLLSAGNTPGSPQLNSFGPNMSLAKELLEKGEMEVVIKYFQLCANFWEMGKDRLEAWTAAVRTSEMPDFGANLDY